MKDESETLRRAAHKTPFDHFYDAAHTGDLDRLTKASPSFAVFRKEVEGLRTVWGNTGSDRTD